MKMQALLSELMSSWQKLCPPPKSNAKGSERHGNPTLAAREELNPEGICDGSWGKEDLTEG